MVARVPALLSDGSYQAANEAFLSRWSSDEDELQAFLKKHAPSAADDVYVLSVGAGNGNRDVLALQTLKGSYKKTISYTAVEPNKAQTDLLRNNMKKAASSIDNLTLTVIEAKAEDYVFGEGLHDIVLFTHSFYHMAGCEKEVLRNAVKSLKKGGRIIVALSTENGGINQMMGSFWGEIDYSHFETGGGLFGQEKFLKLAADEKLEVDLQVLPDVYIDVEDASSDLLNFIMQCDSSKLPEEMLKRVKNKLTELSPSQRLPHGSGLICIVTD